MVAGGVSRGGIEGKVFGCDEVSFRQACVNLFLACGIIDRCRGITLWRTADEYQEDMRAACAAAGGSEAIRAVASNA